jgi:catechol 2,3-dioxygenase-like lactoylglutathione lyase family enzyme
MTSTNDVILRTSDLEAAKAFYNGVLGFPIVADDGIRLVGFDTGSFNLYLELGEPNGAVFEFEVDDVNASKVALMAQGCSLVEEIPTLPRCYLRDRFGLVFNLNRRDVAEAP